MVVALSASLTTVKGSIHHILFHDQASGFIVFQLKTDNFDIIAASGTMPDAKQDLEVELQGRWKVHPKYGNQFNFLVYKIPEPTSAEGIVAFLKTLEKVGEATAQLIVDTFGDKTFEVFDETPEKLLEIKGIGNKTLPLIMKSYNEKKGLSKLIGFLHTLGVSAGYAKALHKEYGDDAVKVIKSNPYLLAEEVKGFGFKKADEIALGLGIAPDAPDRIKAAVLYVMKGVAARYGHCYLPVYELQSMVSETISLPNYNPDPLSIEAVVKQLQTGKHPILVKEKEAIYLSSYHSDEVQLAQKIKKMCGSIKSDSLTEWIAEYEEKQEIQLAPGQKKAVITAASNGFSVVTGGAGTGKTSVSKAIIQYWQNQKKRVVGVAPTGKAAQRIKEATGLSEANTIHRLLGWTGSDFNYNSNHPYPADAFLIDESSMMDLHLAYSLFAAIPLHASVVFVGDVNQLPSVGAGNVLLDVIKSGEIPVAQLTEIFRQADTSRIIQASLAINKGEMPHLEQIGRTTDKPQTDALWVRCSQSQIPTAIKWLVAEKLPELGWQKDNIQCLSPTHKGDCGNIELNKLIQSAWNPKHATKPEQGQFRVGDRVIQTNNNYDKKVFNGDIGKIESIELEDKITWIRFSDMDEDGKLVKYTFGEMSDLMLAYSISVHKAQGAEFPVVIFPVSMQQYMMLQRNLLYTAVTRGKKLVIVVGEEKPLEVAVKTNKIQSRNTKLRERLINK